MTKRNGDRRSVDLVRGMDTARLKDKAGILGITSWIVFPIIAVCSNRPVVQP